MFVMLSMMKIVGDRIIGTETVSYLFLYWLETSWDSDR